MEFYQVTAKCGHVGKGQYYKGLLYVKAENARSAAEIARWKPRVKKHHKDAILSVEKVSRTEFDAGRAKHLANPFFTCNNVQKQRLFWEEIAENVYSEDEYENHRQNDRADKLAKSEALRRYYRKMNKYGVKEC